MATYLTLLNGDHVTKNFTNIATDPKYTELNLIHTWNQE